MPTSSQTKLKREMSLAGYFRMIESILKQDIPNEISQLIILYQRMLSIFGVGSGGVFSALNVDDKFTPLTQLDELQCDYHKIYRNNRAMMMITANDELYALGHNGGYRLGAKDGDYIPLTKLQDNVKLVSSGSENYLHTASQICLEL